LLGSRFFLYFRLYWILSYHCLMAEANLN
jgi:hypothetical protein